MIQNRIIKSIVLVLIVCFCLLSILGCSMAEERKGITIDDIFNNTILVHQNLDSIEVHITEVSTSHGIELEDTAIIKMHFDEQSISIQNSQYNHHIIMKDDTIVESFGERVSEVPSDDMYYSRKIDGAFELHGNWLEYIQKADETIVSLFSFDEKDDYYLLQFNGDDEHQQRLLALFDYGHYMTNFEEELDYYVGRYDVNHFSLKVFINKERFIIEKIEKAFDYTLYENSYEETITYEYVNVNQVAEIDLPTITATEPERFESTEYSEEEIETYEQEAADYLAALIQATVFQDIDSYIALDPSPLGDEQKKNAATLQKEFFVEMYKTNTMSIAAEVDVELPEELINELTKSLLHALSQTKYEIVGSSYESGNAFTVTLEIEGFSDYKIMERVNEKILATDNVLNMSMDEIVTLNYEYLTELYNGQMTLEEPKVYEVIVNRNEDGSYLVLLQDQFLSGFVQSY